MLFSHVFISVLYADVNIIATLWSVGKEMNEVNENRLSNRLVLLQLESASMLHNWALVMI